MSKRQFLLGVFILVTIIGVGSAIGYFSLQNNIVNKNALVEQEKIKQDEKTQRTKERSGVFNNLPFMRKD